MSSLLRSSISTAPSVVPCCTVYLALTMSNPDFIRQAAQQGRLLSAHPDLDEAGDPRPSQAFAGFHAAPIYRCYLHPLDRRGLNPNILSSLHHIAPLHLVRDGEARQRNTRILAYLEEQPLGVLPHEDSLLLEKFERRGLPIVAQLIGAQPDEQPERQLAVEIALLYPPHPTTDEAISVQERNRRDGLAKLRHKPDRRLRLTRDPLSSAHVFPSYFEL